MSPSAAGTRAVDPGGTDIHDAHRTRTAPGVLRAFNDAGVLGAADVHVARRLAAVTAAGATGDPGAGDGDDAVLLGVALAVRAPRLGHVCVDVADARRLAAAEAEAPDAVDALPWPEPDGWLATLSSHPLVAVGADGDDQRPLRLVGSRLYLDRYWRQERRIVDEIRTRAGVTGAAAPGADGVGVAVDEDALTHGLDRLFGPVGDEPDLQRRAAEVAVRRRLTVVAGGPGTGKTTTVARILALLHAQSRNGPPRVALAAPTGKAAARLQEAVHGAAAGLDVDDEIRHRLLGVSASTVHRLLGWRPDSHSRFRHHAGNRLPHDVVVVDEASMVSLSLMARLLEAVRPDARLVLVGDPDQLASVEAGAVLGDIVGPAALTDRSVPVAAPAGGATGGTGVAEGIVVLRRVHRFAGSIARLAEAVRRGDADAAVAVLAGGDDDVSWMTADLDDRAVRDDLDPLRRRVVAAGRAVHAAAVAGDGRAALDALGAVRVLCAHRHGPFGVATWMPVVESWLVDAIDGYAAGGRWYVGRPLLVTENDYGLQLYNGDAGVVVDAGAGQVRAVFERRGVPVGVSPSRLGAVETVHAMTVHKSQGSQFGAVAVLLPDEASPLLSRELLYTAVTHAQHHLTVVGTEAAVRAAVARPIARASGLRAGLWDETATGP